jgi:hypothetical protein
VEDWVRVGVALLALGLGSFGAACAGSGDGDQAAAVEAGEVGPVGSTVPEPVPDTKPDKGRQVGDVVTVGAGGKVGVLDVEDDVNAGALFHPDKGKRYYAVEVKGCAGENESDLSFEPEYFGLRLEGGSVSVPSLGVKKPDLRGGTLSEGKCLSGWITYEIPEKVKAIGVVYNGASFFEWGINP